MRAKLLLPFSCLLFAFLGACGDDPDSTSEPCTVQNDQPGVLYVLATTPEFDASSLEAIAPECTSSTTGLVTVSGDAVLRARSGEPIWLLNRGDASSLITLAEDLSVANEVPLPSCNAQEVIALDDGSAFVTCRQGTTALRVFEAGAQPSTDLAPFADGDGSPEMTAAARVGDRIFVVLQRQDRATLAPVGNGQLVVIDASTLEVVDADDSTTAVDAVDLPCENPTSRLRASGDTLYVSCAGDFSGDGNGGVVAVELDSLSATLVLSDAALEGYPTALAVEGDDAFVLVAIPGAERFSTEEMRAVRIRSGAQEVLYRSPGFSLAGLAVADGVLYVGDRSVDDTAGVYRVFLQSNAVDGPITTEIPPFDLAVR